MLTHIPNDIDAKPLSPDEKELETAERVKRNREFNTPFDNCRNRLPSTAS